MSEQKIQIGLPNEWQTFLNDNRKFVEKLTLLYDTLRKAFIRKFMSKGPADLIVFYLGRIAVEDFNEILLLSGNGHGVGAQKILRGLYERAVTSRYISLYPDEAQLFFDYDAVIRGKQYNHAQIPELSGVFTQEQAEEIKKAYQLAKAKFQEPLCDKCGTTRTQISWSRLDTASMAHKAGAGLGKLYLPCYFEPTMQAHATVSSLISRLVLVEGGGLSFKDSAQRDVAKHALLKAHNLILIVLATQNEYFHLQMENEIQKRFEEFHEVWDSDGND